MKNLSKPLIFIIIIILLLFSCNMDDNTIPSDAMKTTQTNKEWVEGLFYHTHGDDTTIVSQPYNLIRFNKQTIKYDTTLFHKVAHRLWEHKYTAGAMREDIYYWDDKSGVWYIFNRSGDYWTYKWVITISEI